MVNDNDPTAEVTIRVHPAGEPGTVTIEVIDTGRAPLTRAETARILRMALFELADEQSKEEGEENSTSVLRMMARENGHNMVEFEPGRYYADKQLPPVQRRLAP